MKKAVSDQKLIEEAQKHMRKGLSAYASVAKVFSARHIHSPGPCGRFRKILHLVEKPTVQQVTAPVVTPQTETTTSEESEEKEPHFYWQKGQYA